MFETSTSGLVLSNVHSSRESDIFSDEVAALVTIVDNAVLGHFICAFGIVTNLINIAIFTKLGFSDTVNISLLGLAVSDLISLVGMEGTNILETPLFADSGIPWSTHEVQYLSGGTIHAIFARVTSWITAYVTFERCLCVLMPLKVRRLITARVTVAVMVCIYILMILTHVSEYASAYLGWKFYPETNKTLLGLLFRENRSECEGIFFILGFLAQTTSFLAVIIFTMLLVIRMKRTSKWRQEVTSGNTNMSQKRQARDDRTVKTIVLIAVIYITCYSPSILVYFSSVFEPRLNNVGQYKNVFIVCWSLIFVMEAINSSVNIFVYYKMSGKYRSSLDQMLCFKKYTATTIAQGAVKRR